MLLLLILVHKCPTDTNRYLNICSNDYLNNIFSYLLNANCESAINKNHRSCSDHESPLNETCLFNYI